MKKTLLPERRFGMSIILLLAAIAVILGCEPVPMGGGGSNGGGTNSRIGLVLNTSTRMLSSGTYYGTVYEGTWTAADGVQLDVWVSIRETDPDPGDPDIDLINRLGVEIQGGTGITINSSLNGDRGQHTAWITVNMRGSNITDIAAGQECPPGPDLVSCLKSHATFSKTNPKLNAQDANAVIDLFTGNKDITVNGTSVKASTFLPDGINTDAINLYTSSFGGVIFGYMLAESNRPALNNVFLAQVTAPSEQPISDGLTTADRMLDNLFDSCEDDGHLQCNVCKHAYKLPQLHGCQGRNSHHH